MNKYDEEWLQWSKHKYAASTPCTYSNRHSTGSTKDERAVRRSTVVVKLKKVNLYIHCMLQWPFYDYVRDLICPFCVNKAPAKLFGGLFNGRTKDGYDLTFLQT